MTTLLRIAVLTAGKKIKQEFLTIARGEPAD
jgi:hypothetical protein